jgi:hypothetical protein
LEINHEEDAGVQMQRLAEATNKNIMLTEQLVAIGTQLNLAKLDILRAENEEAKLKAKIVHQEIEGKYKETQARIRCQKEIMSSIKYLIKAEGSKF